MPLWVLIAVGLVSVVVSVGVGRWAMRVIDRHDEPTTSPGSLAGKEVARAVLRRGGVGRVDVTAGDIDCYISSYRWIQLADGRFERASASASAVAAHEAAHAIQDLSGWRPFKISMFTRDLALLSSVAFFPLVGAAAAADLAIVGWIALADAGYILLASCFTVWIEVDASRRAIEHLETLELPDADLAAARKVLFACGATYAVETVFDLGYFTRRSRRDDEGDDSSGGGGRGDSRDSDGAGSSDDGGGAGGGDSGGGSDFGGSWGGCGGGS